MTHFSPPPKAVRRKAIISFGLFFLFFIFYILAAVIQTPAYEEVAALRVFAMPLGLLLSLLIFPVSWLIMAVWFWRSK